MRWSTARPGRGQGHPEHIQMPSSRVTQTEVLLSPQQCSQPFRWGRGAGACRVPHLQGRVSGSHGQLLEQVTAQWPLEGEDRLRLELNP